MSEKLIDIRALEATGEFGAVWVLNNTKRKSRSQITFTVPSSSGKEEDQIFIPSTFIPINLTGQVSKKQLLNSSNFRRAFTKGVIKILDETYAESLMQQEGAGEEMARLAKEHEQHSDFAFAAGIVHGTSSDAMVVAGVEVDEGEEGIMPAILAILVSLEEGEVNEGEALGKLRALGDLEIAEYKFISQKTKDYERIQRWIKGIRSRIDSQSSNRA